MGAVLRVECPKCPWSGGMNDASMRDLETAWPVYHYNGPGVHPHLVPSVRVIKAAVPTCPQCGEDVRVVEVDDEEGY